MHKLRILSCLAAVVATSAAMASDAPVVLELFTSQGCSSCPPADRMLDELADRPGVIGLSMAVDYWDYLGWKDTLARHVNTARQRAYAEARGDRRLSTPQFIINGRDVVPGHDRAAIERILTVAKGRDGAAVDARLGGDGLEIKVSGTLASSQAAIWVFGVQNTVVVAIGRGENAGRTAKYRNVVRTMKKVASWSGGDARIRTALDGIAGRDIDQVVVVIQETPRDRLGRIVGAARLAL